MEVEHTDQAVEMAGSIRQLINDTQFIFESQALSVTISVGIAQFKADMSLPNLLAKADKQLYLAKNLGRNKVMFEIS